ncbi:hypothetical protein BC938DRAFT_481916 [Jimgerdemannia flammicorona]|uniref:Spondin domain-containing protein n=1 Tax=Jimgerdemannia flammicorona TaxID=994334 RepID=A0A433QF60_9FUNG|nr:hypothetical protein BC938DRAFT_481916 [Jimgerdemannia flammicorona]
MVTLRLFALPALAISISAVPVEDHSKNRPLAWNVTVENLNYKQSFSPVVAAIHEPSFHIFQTSTVASPELRQVAETAKPDMLVALLKTMPKGVCGWAVAPGFTTPGKFWTGTITLTKPCESPHLSVVSMLAQTNDAFTGVNSFPLTRDMVNVRFDATAYDAGTEVNNEDCAYIPGCTGSPNLDTGGVGEGFITVHRGVHGILTNKPALTVDNDWRFPVSHIFMSSDSERKSKLWLEWSAEQAPALGARDSALVDPASGVFVATGGDGTVMGVARSGLLFMAAGCSTRSGQVSTV